MAFMQDFETLTSDPDLASRYQNTHVLGLLIASLCLVYAHNHSSFIHGIDCV